MIDQLSNVTTCVRCLVGIRSLNSSNTNIRLWFEDNGPLKPPQCKLCDTDWTETNMKLSKRKQKFRKHARDSADHERLLLKHIKETT